MQFFLFFNKDSLQRSLPFSYWNPQNSLCIYFAVSGFFDRWRSGCIDTIHDLTTVISKIIKVLILVSMQKLELE